MKQLMILRHAKAAPEDFYADDHARALNERGREAASAVAEYMVNKNLQPGLVFCSTARRTQETWEILSTTLQVPPSNIHYDKRLYLASAGDIVTFVQATQSPEKSLLLIGHNPGLHVLALELAGSGDAALHTKLRQNFPTAALAVLRFEVENWADIAVGEGTLTHFVTPKSV